MTDRPILGIDLGMNKMGLTMIKRAPNSKLIAKNIQAESQVITLPEPPKVKGKKQKIDKVDKQIQFLNKTFLFPAETDIHDAIQDSQLVVIEKPFGIRGWATVLFELLGIIRLYCIKYNTSYIEVPQTTLKKFATGSGRADKSEMIMKAYKEFKFEAGTEDEVDAFWCAMAGHCVLNPEVFTKGRIDSAKKLTIIDMVNATREIF